MADNIDDIVGSRSFEQLKLLEERLDVNARKLAEIANTVINVEVKYSGGSAANLISSTNTLVEAQNKAARSRTELGIALNEYKKIADSTAVSQGKLAALDSEEAKASIAAKAAVSDKTREIKALDDAYKQLSLQLQKVTAEGKRNGVELGRTSPEYQKLVAQAKQLRDELYAIDSDFGDHRRNIGNYRSAFNGLAASFNQLTRELPALAINANTFFLAISNNLPIFIDELRRATDANKAAKIEAQAMAQAAALQAKEQALANNQTMLAAENAGKLAAQQALANAEATVSVSITKQLFKAIFSWQTLLSIGVALLTIYGGKILEAFSGGESAADKFDAALKKVTESTNADVSNLIKLQAALSGTNKNRLDLQKSFDDARSKYPEYLGYLSLEHSTTQEINKAIEQQIQLLEVRTKQQAAQEVVAEAVEKQREAEQKLERVLTGNLGNWEKLLYTAASYTNELSHLTPEQIALTDAISGVTKSQNEVRKATELAIDPIKEQISTAILYQDKLRTEVQAIQESAKSAGEYTAAQTNTIRVKQNLINITEDLINSLVRERAEVMLAGKTTLDQTQLAALNAQTRFLNAKKNSAEELKLRKESIEAQLKVDEEALYREYQIGNANLALNKEYQAKLANLRAKARNDEESASDAFNKRNRPKNTSRAINQEYKAQEDLNKALSDLYRQRVEADATYQETIYTNQKESLDKRLQAYDQYVQDQMVLYDIDSNLEIQNLSTRLQKIDELKKLQVNQNKASQDALAKDEEALNARILTIQENRAILTKQIQDKSAKEQRDIIKTSAEYAAQQARQFLQNIENGVNKGLRATQTELNKQLDDGLINQREYHQKWVAAEQKANTEISEAQIKYLKEQIAFAENAISNTTSFSEAEKAAVKQYLADLSNLLGGVNTPKLRTDRKPLSVLYMLGFGNDPNMTTEQILEQQKRVLAQSIKSLWDGLFEVMSAAGQQEFEAENTRLDNEKKRLEERSEAEKAAIESSLLSEEEKQRKLSELDGRTLAEEKSIDNERRQLQREQAQRERDDAIFKIALNGAIAISQALTTIVKGNPASIAIALATAGVIAAQTAAAIAVASSRPIPSYMEGAGPGTPNPAHPGGPAVVHGGELATLPSGKQFITPGGVNTGTLMDLPTGTTITPNDQLMQSAQQKAMVALGLPGARVNEHVYAEALINTFREEIGSLKDTIKNKPVVDIDIQNGQLRAALKRQHSITKYVNKIKGRA